MSERKYGVVIQAAIGLISLLPWVCEAAFDGEIRSTQGTQIYNIDIGNMNITSNVAGAEYSFPFSLSENYPGEAYCTHLMDQKAILFSGEASVLQPGSTPQFLKLNDYMDVKVEIFIGGWEQQNHAVPFNDVTNKADQNTCNPASPNNHGGWQALTQKFNSGGKGVVTFKLTKPIINGVNLQGTEVARLFGRLDGGVAGRGTPMAQVNLNSGILTVADKCIFNNGSPINVAFGTIPGTGSKLNGVDYSQPVPIHVKCQGGSFSTGNMSVKLSIRQPNPAGFNSDYLSTTGANDRSNLGIVLRDSGGNTVVPNQFYPAKGFTNNEGDWNLTAAPIANNSVDIPEGDFSASATVVAEFQ